MCCYCESVDVSVAGASSVVAGVSSEMFGSNNRLDVSAPLSSLELLSKTIGFASAELSTADAGVVRPSVFERNPPDEP